MYVYDYDVRIIPREFEKTEHANFCMDGEFLGTYEISFMDIGREIQLQVEGGGDFKQIMRRWLAEDIDKLPAKKR